MGYDNYHIIRNLYSADTSLFNKKANPCKRFVYLGRFLRTKGIINLVESYERLPESIKKEWPLVLIGDGPLMQEVKEKGSDHIIIKGFLQPKELQIELSKGGVCCMPSTLEQWGVSIHEFALMGYPLILSSVCGAATEFLIKGYNGYLFRLEEKDGLCDAFKKITLLDEDELELFSQRSYLLGQRINPELSVYSLLSILE
jgi:glycosyltransferase involved in cell wall biosynthesis